MSTIKMIPLGGQGHGETKSATSAPVPAMADQNTFLRRADVEALIDVKIAWCDERIAGAERNMIEADMKNADAFMQAAAQKEDLRSRRGALSVLRGHLAHCEQFTLTDGLGDSDHLARADGSPVSVR